MLFLFIFFYTFFCKFRCYNNDMKLIVAPRYLHKSILNKYRQNDVFCDIKLTSKEELQRYCYITFNNEALIYLMKERHYSYQVSKMYLEFLPFVKNETGNKKIDFLFALKNELEDKGLTVSLDDKHNLFKNKEVDIVGYDKSDKELVNLLSKLNCHYQYIDYEITKKDFVVYTFDKIENEVYYVLNKIATLLDSGVSIKDIFILRRNKNYDYYLNKFVDSFGFQLNIEEKESYLSTGAFKEFKILYEDNHDAKLSLTKLKEIMKDDEFYFDFESAINNYIIEDLDFILQKDYLYNKLSETKLNKGKYDQAVEVISHPIYAENKYIFVLGFSQGLFPQTYKDDKYLNNNEMSLLDRNNAKDKTRIDGENLIHFFNSKNNFVFSFSERDIKGAYYISPIYRILNFKKENRNLDNTFYSEKILTYIYTNLKDLEYLYKERGDDYFKIRDVIDIKYGSYDNSYRYKVSAYDQNSYLKLSTTQLEQYSQCPFHYYLSRVVKLDEDESTFSMALGNIAHYIFEHQRDKNFDFDTEFAKKISEYSFPIDQMFLLKTKLKEQIKIASEAIKLRDRYYLNPTFENEKELNIKISDNTYLTGRIDSLVTINNQYVICIDYKTGGLNSSAFKEDRLEYGLSSQLPTYTLLVNNIEKYQDLEVSGIYINHVISDAMINEKKEDNLIFDYLKLHGRTINDLNIVSQIDGTIADGVSSFIASIKLNKSNELDTKYGVISKEKMEEYSLIVKDQYLKMDKNIRNNNFDIHPIFFDNNEHACQYCPYKDICYVKPYQKNVIKEEEAKNE